MITAVPLIPPLIVPKPGKGTLATGALPLAHVPPPDVLLNVVDVPEQNAVVPVIPAGKGFTVTTTLIEQPPPVHMIVDVPVVSPETIPDDEPTVATAGAVLLHVTDGVVLESALVFPTHTSNDPVIGFGFGLTVTTLVTVQLPLAAGKV